jgi:hypothetical protein
MTKEDKLYQELIEIAEYIAEKRKLGWLLIDENNDIITDEFVYKTSFDDKCIALNDGGRVWRTVVVYGETAYFGESTLLKEYRAAKKYLKTFKLLEPKKIHKL